MKEIVKIIKSILGTASTNEKIKIIQKNKDNEEFVRCLQFLLDPGITTGISRKKIDKKVPPVKDLELESISDCMEYLKANNTGTDRNVYVIKKFLSKLSEEEREIAKLLLTKSLKLGCSVKSVNAAIPGLIEEWEVQLGSPEKELKLKPREKFFLSQKLNGNRCSWYHSQLKSRQNKVFTGMQHIIDDIESLGLSDMFLDGELIRKNTDGVSDSENFQIGTGIINSDAEEKTEIKFVIFDMFPASEFPSKKPTDPYSVRKQNLLKLKEEISSDNIEVVTMVYEGNNPGEIQTWLEYAESNDWEGLMLNKDTPYECKRTKNLIKIKRFKTVDLVITDLEEGTGRLTGTLGALVVSYKGNTVRVGSGFTDEQRKEIWTNKDDYTGKIAEVKYKEETVDKKTKRPSLQFPVFVTIREDKENESYF